jgi:hypothetical protein
MGRKRGPATMAGLVAYRKPYGSTGITAMNTRLIILRASKASRI